MFEVSLAGTLKARREDKSVAPLGWRVRNALRLGYIWGIVTVWLAHLLTKVTGIPTLTSALRLRFKRAGGDWVDYGVVSRRVITNAGVAFIVDAWDNTVELENMKYHGCGTGTTAENVADTTLVTESTTALNPDSTRATGTQSQPAANQLRSSGTVTFDGSAAITEHGLFSQAATGGGVLFDRSVFSAINVAASDSISFEYTVSFVSGG